MKRKIFIGIDPGKSGFITILKDGDYIFLSMPEHKVETGEFTKTGKPKTKTVFYEEGLRSIVFDLANYCHGYDIVCGIEEVTGRNGWSAQNNFNFGRVAGLQKMMMIVLKANIIMVRPQKWQSESRNYYKVENIKKPSSTGKTMIGDPKAVAEKIVQKRFPDIDFRKTDRAKKNDDNKIDSFLICNYIARNFSD